MRWLLKDSPSENSPEAKEDSSDPWFGPVRHASDYFHTINKAAVYLIEHDLAYVDDLSPGNGFTYPLLSNPILSYPLLPNPILSSPAQSYPILSCSDISYPLLPNPILSYPLLSCPILFYLVLYYPILTCPIPSYPDISYSILS